MNKKIIALLTTLCICLSFTVNTYAYTLNKDKNVYNNPDVYSDPLYNTERIITESEIFNPNESKGNGDNIIVPNVIVPSHYGQVKIDSSNSGDSGISNTDTKSGYWSSIQYATMKLLPYIPAIGQLTTRTIDVYNGIKAVYTDISSFDTSRTTSIYTRYVYRYLYLTGYVWDYDDSWKFYGESTSKAFYKVQTFDCIKSGNFVTKTRSYTAGNGYSPTAIQKAPHYNDTSGLSNIFYEHWACGLPAYYETY